MKKPKVIVTRKLQDKVEKRMMELFNVDLSNAEYPVSRKELLSAVKEEILGGRLSILLIVISKLAVEELPTISVTVATT